MTFKSICRTLLALALSTGLTLTVASRTAGTGAADPALDTAAPPAAKLAQAPTTGDAR